MPSDFAEEFEVRRQLFLEARKHSRDQEEINRAYRHWLATSAAITDRRRGFANRRPVLERRPQR